MFFYIYLLRFVFFLLTLAYEPHTMKQFQIHLRVCVRVFSLYILQLHKFEVTQMKIDTQQMKKRRWTKTCEAAKKKRNPDKSSEACMYCYTHTYTSTAVCKMNFLAGIFRIQIHTLLTMQFYPPLIQIHSPWFQVNVRKVIEEKMKMNWQKDGWDAWDEER